MNHNQLIDIHDLDKADVLAALYNASRPVGLGFLHYTPRPMTHDEAAVVLGAVRRDAPAWKPDQQDQIALEYLHGRALKIDLGADQIDPQGYDGVNGRGAAASVITTLRATQNPQDPTLLAVHQLGMEGAAQDVRRDLTLPAHTSDIGGVRVYTLGLADHAGLLGPALDRAVGPAADEESES